jgi:Family of unknown function (DUF5331)
VNTEELRQSVKIKWLDYYRENRHWLSRLAIWSTYKGQRRPSSSFILATMSLLEPQLPFIFPIVVELSNDPDRIVAALGLNFNPDQELAALTKATLSQAELSQKSLSETEQAAIPAAEVKLLPRPVPESNFSVKRTSIRADEDCRGYRSDR